MAGIWEVLISAAETIASAIGIHNTAAIRPGSSQRLKLWGTITTVYSTIIAMPKMLATWM